MTSDFAVSIGKNPKDDNDQLKAIGGAVALGGVVLGLMFFLLGLRRRRPRDGIDDPRSRRPAHCMDAGPLPARRAPPPSAATARRCPARPRPMTRPAARSARPNSTWNGVRAATMQSAGCAASASAAVERGWTIPKEDEGDDSSEAAHDGDDPAEDLHLVGVEHHRLRRGLAGISVIGRALALERLDGRLLAGDAGDDDLAIDGGGLARGRRRSRRP